MTYVLEHQLRVNVDRYVGVEAKNFFVAATKNELKRLIARGEASRYYTRYVNGRENALEESVVLPGPIRYDFQWMGKMAVYAISFLKARWRVLGPGRGGHFYDSYFVMANGVEIKVEDSDKYTEITIVNDKPYARKAQVGAKGFSLSKNMFLDCARAIQNEFGSERVKARLKFVPLDGGYVLRKRRKTNASGRSEGVDMRYPAVVIALK